MSGSPAPAHLAPMPTVNEQTFREVSYNLTKEFVKLIDQKEGWTVVSEDGGVKIETRKFDDHHIICARGSCVVKQMPQMVFKAVLDPEIQVKLDPSLKLRKSLKVLDDYHEIVYYQYGCPMPVQDRDFVIFESNEKAEGHLHFVSYGRSVRRPDLMPEAVPSHTRGDVLVSGYDVRPHGNGETLLTFLVQADPAGYLPATFVNMEAQNQPKLVLKIKAMTEDPKYVPITDKWLPEEHGPEPYDPSQI